MIDKIDTNILDKSLEYVKIYNDYCVLYNQYTETLEEIENKEELNEKSSLEKIEDTIKDTERMEALDEKLKKEFSIKCDSYNVIKDLCMDEDLAELYVFMATSIINEEYENTATYKKLIIEYTNILYDSYNDLD